MNYICMLCFEEIDEKEEHMIAEEYGPFGLFDGKEFGRAHKECYIQSYEEDDE